MSLFDRTKNPILTQKLSSNIQIVFCG